jgi:hypothetical protein
MAYDNNQKKESTYDKSKDTVFAKYSCNPTGKKYFNIEVYSYDGGPTKIRIRQTAANTNPNCDANKKWINLPGISGIKPEELGGLIDVLQKAKNCPDL